MNILYISARNVLSDNYPYQYYGDLYRELRLIHNVYVYQGPIVHINDVLSRYNNIDCLIFDLGYFAQKDSNVFKQIPGLKELSIPKVAHFSKPQTLLREKLEFCNVNNFDLFVDSNNTCKSYSKIANCVPMRLPYVASAEQFYPRPVEKIYDLGFSGTLRMITPEGKVKGPTRDIRYRIQDKILEKKSSYDLFWNIHNSSSDRISSIEEYALKINQSKIWLSTTGPIFDISPRYFEVMLSKTLLFCNNMPDVYEDLFEDGVNCVMYENDLSDFLEKLNYYLNNDIERNEIIERAYKTSVDTYTWKIMAKNLIEKIKEIKTCI